MTLFRVWIDGGAVGLMYQSVLLFSVEAIGTNRYSRRRTINYRYKVIDFWLCKPFISHGWFFLKLVSRIDSWHKWPLKTSLDCNRLSYCSLFRLHSVRLLPWQCYRWFIPDTTISRSTVYCPWALPFQAWLLNGHLFLLSFVFPLFFLFPCWFTAELHFARLFSRLARSSFIVSASSPWILPCLAGSPALDRAFRLVLSWQCLSLRAA